MTLFKPLRGVTVSGTSAVSGDRFDKFNFLGPDVTVTQGNEPGEVYVNIDPTPAPAFGSNFYNAYSEALSSTTSTNYQTKLELNVNGLTYGQYRIGWYYEWSAVDTKKNFLARVLINDDYAIMEQGEMPHKVVDDSNYPQSGFGFYTGDGNLNIKLDYCTADKKKAAYIQRVRLELWRIS